MGDTEDLNRRLNEALLEIRDCIEQYVEPGDGTGIDDVKMDALKRLAAAVGRIIEVRLGNRTTLPSGLLHEIPNLEYPADKQRVRLGLALLEYIDTCLKR